MDVGVLGNFDVKPTIIQIEILQKVVNDEYKSWINQLVQLALMSSYPIISTTLHVGSH